MSILAADVHHAGGGNALRQRARRESATVADGVRFHWFETPRYSGNGAGRLRNMIAFSHSVWRAPTQLDAIGLPDVVIGSSPHPFAALAAQRAASRLRVPFVLEIRDLWPDSLVKVAGMSARHPVVRALSRLEKHLYRVADVIVTLLPAATDHISARGGERNRVVWVPNGVDFTLVPAPTPRPGSAPFTVAYAGSHGLANAMDSMLSAARILREHRDVHFRFVGDGSERCRLKELAQREGLTNVHFDEPVPKERIYGVLQNADVLLATTRNIDLYAHGLSFNKLFDYLASGRPVVFGAACPGNPIEEADAGLIVPPEDSSAMASAILQIAARTPEERFEIGLRGRRFAEANYDMSKLAARMEEALILAVGGHSQREKPAAS